MQEIGVMHVSVEQAEHAFRINGVTVAKRHLVNKFRKDQNNPEKLLSKYLVIVPFLATSYQMPDNADDSTKYAVAKAKRLYKALELNDDNIVPFMMVFMQQAGNETIDSIGDQLQASFEPGSVKSPGKRTLH